MGNDPSLNKGPIECQGYIKNSSPISEELFELPYGKVYKKIFDKKNNGDNHLKWSYFSIYDLRNCKVTWRLSTKIVDNKLKFVLGFVGSDEKLNLEISDYTNNTLSLSYKGFLDSRKYTLELHYYNIHSHLTSLDKNKILVEKWYITGLLKINNNVSIPIVI